MILTVRRELVETRKAIREDSWTEIVQLGRQTDVPKVQSYQDERDVPLFGCSSSPDEGGDAANVIALIDADVCNHREPVAIVVPRGAEGVSHRHTALEVGNCVGFCVLAVKAYPDARRENVEEQRNCIRRERELVLGLLAIPDPILRYRRRAEKPPQKATWAT